jgi:hypothetical protein
MGTNCAVFVANLFLFTYELEFMEKRMVAKQYDIVRRFEFTFRYIDDVLSFHNRLFEKMRYLIYPKSMLSLNTKQSGSNISFLDMRIHKRSLSIHAPYRSTIFDKRSCSKYASLDKNKYPHLYSFIPSRMKFNIVLSECWRYSRICLTKRAFVFNTAKLATELILKGYSRSRLLRQCRSFLKRAPLLYHSTSPSKLLRSISSRIKLLLKNGIPFVDAHAL